MELPKHLREKLIHEIRGRLRSLNAAANTTEQHGGFKIDFNTEFKIMSMYVLFMSGSTEIDYFPPKLFSIWGNMLLL